MIWSDQIIRTALIRWQGTISSTEFSHEADFYKDSSINQDSFQEENTIYSSQTIDF